MQLFNIYIKESLNQIEELVVVKNGFSFYAFLFNIFWFLQHKMWKEFFTILLINIIIGITIQQEWFVDSNATILQLGLILMIALNANYWYGQSLLKQNYQFSGCIFGKNDDEARLKFVTNYFQNNTKNNIPYSIDPMSFKFKN